MFTAVGMLASSTTTRMEEAVSAIKQITSTYAGRVRFGLSIYPLQPTPIPTCSRTCNWFSCTDFSSLDAGRRAGEA